MNPKIRLIGRYGDYRMGQILNPPASLRKILFDRKLAVFHEEQPAEVNKDKSEMKPDKSETTTATTCKGKYAMASVNGTPAWRCYTCGTDFYGDRDCPKCSAKPKGKKRR